MYVLGGARSSGGKRAGPTIYELNAHGEQRSARVAGAGALAGRRERASDTAGIVRAAERAGADGDISSLPDGYETLPGPAFIDGTDLSTGQWQRLALARTLQASPYQ
jgi:hypothetical protein